LINFQNLSEINPLILITSNFCIRSETPRKLQSSTTGCCYLSQTKAKSKKNGWWWCSTQTV